MTREVVVGTGTGLATSDMVLRPSLSPDCEPNAHDATERPNQQLYQPEPTTVESSKFWRCTKS